MSLQQYPWPIPPSEVAPPIWTGSGFRVAGRSPVVPSYDGDESGWTDELTEFDEQYAGDSHPIGVASRRHAMEQLHRWVKGNEATILEVGCSSGMMLKEIKRQFPRAGVMGADYIAAPLKRLLREIPEVPLLQFDLTHCPLPSGTIDAIVLLNVLEHIQDDVRAVRHCCRILKPGGVAIIELPAGPHLFDFLDRQLMHFRRYEMRGLCRMLREAGFRIGDASHLGFFVYPAFSWAKRRNQRRECPERQTERKLMEKQVTVTAGSRLLDWAIRFELQLGRWVSYPCGIRCMVTAIKE
jgi:SAM-dependent methyltransferase